VQETAEKPGFSMTDTKKRVQTLETYVRKHPRRLAKGFINLHVHTSESFSVFQSPTEAVWHAYCEDILYFGINDHYTIAGHPEFRDACAAAGIRAGFSIEAIAMDEKALKKNRRYNDPDNPGRMYLIGKGVIRDLKRESRSHLTAMQDAIRMRNRRIVEKLNGYAGRRGILLELTYTDAELLTPNGNTTERHVVQAMCDRIAERYPDIEKRRVVYEHLIDYPVDDKTVIDSAEIQTLVRARLVKSGCPCYVEEDEKAFTTVENLVMMYRAYGSVPTYPLMGNPITEEEEDLGQLVRKMLDIGLFAFDIIDYRTEVRRAGEVIDTASRYGLPVFIGTEHNTKTMLPLVGPVAGAPDYYDYFLRSANFLLGHQLLGALCDYGSVTKSGKTRFNDLHTWFQFYERIGKMNISAEKMKLLRKKSVEERRRFFGIDETA